ncbi:MAG: ester cyclase [Chloroflexi bacterium]|nr:ester cyclase [Chloroflexota bacterium]
MSPLSAEELKAIADRWIEEGWQKGNVAVIDELHVPNFVDHAADARAADREGFKQGIADLYAAFPDFYATTEDLVIDLTSQTVTVRWTATGTHRGQFMSVAATGKTINFTGIEIIRIENGKIVERWGEWNGIDLLVQLGAFSLEG